MKAALLTTQERLFSGVQFLRTPRLLTHMGCSSCESPRGKKELLPLAGLSEHLELVGSWLGLMSSTQAPHCALVAGPHWLKASSPSESESVPSCSGHNLVDPLEASEVIPSPPRRGTQPCQGLLVPDQAPLLPGRAPHQKLPHVTHGKQGLAW